MSGGSDEEYNKKELFQKPTMRTISKIRNALTILIRFDEGNCFIPGFPVAAYRIARGFGCHISDQICIVWRMQGYSKTF